ncbi:hypothetical protein TYRP_021154 [Tyrophagus putrescentiae]|nr:hypothetical protein TYRP_021154 [Tyrophagus putrescentiae]
MKSRHFSSGVAINSICLLLLLSVYFTSTVVQSVNLYSHRNWIEQFEKSWPKDETGSAPFLVFHSEYNNGNFLKLNKSVWNDQGLTYPDLSFTYWTSDQVFFRSRENESPPEKNIKLNSENDWKLSDKLNKDFASSLKSISKKQWDNFGFENSDVVTLGLKDVSVKYVEKIDTSNADQFTAYPVDGATFKMVNFTVATDASNGGNTANNDNPKLTMT